MQLTSKQVISAITGAIDFHEEDGFLQFSRFTPQMLTYFSATERQDLHSKADAGIKMDFTTDSDFLKFSYVPYPASRSVECYIDILVNGDLVLHHGNTPIVSEIQHVFLDLPKGTNRLTIYFPCLFYVKVKDFALSDGASYTPFAHKLKILFFGDSITQGCNAFFPSLAYYNLVGAKLDAEVLNQAISGDIFNVDQIEKDVPFSPDMIFIAYGTNDIAKGLLTEEILQAYFQKLCEVWPTQAIYVLLPLWRLDMQEHKEKFLAARQLIADACVLYKNITVVETMDFVPHYPEFFYDNFLHPNELGFVFYANSIVKYLAQR